MTQLYNYYITFRVFSLVFQQCIMPAQYVLLHHYKTLLLMYKPLKKLY